MGQWRLCHELVPGPECVVDGLAPGETYRFRVAAVGPVGAGEPVHLPQTVRLGELLHWGLGSSQPPQARRGRGPQGWGLHPGCIFADGACLLSVNAVTQQRHRSLCLPSPLPLRAGRWQLVRMSVWSLRWQLRLARSSGTRERSASSPVGGSRWSPRVGNRCW